MKPPKRSNDVFISRVSAQAAILANMKNYHSECLINGEWRKATSGSTIAVYNPATQELLAEVPQLSASEVREAIDAAQAAFPRWAATPARERAQLLYTLDALLRAHAGELASLITAEQGKPLREARGEVEYSANYLRWFAEESMRIYGDIIPSDSAQTKIFVLKQPIGVVAAITPWNFPLAMLTRKMAAALAAGCTFIAKPAPETPLSALFLASLCNQAGLPAGVVSIVTGDAVEIGETFMASPRVRKVSFTGSTEVGKLLIRQSADTVKKLTLELGGNAPCIIFDDADISHAIDGAIFGKYRNAGQTCVCINRFLVHKRVAETFTSELVARTKQLKVGNGADESTDIGPLISSAAVHKVRSLVASAISEGALAPLPLEPASLGQLFTSPCVLTNVNPSMGISQQEIFGPVSTVTTFESDAEAVALANDTPYGLAAYIYSRDLSRAMQCAEQLECGMVGVNSTLISSTQAPFGGIKQSGFGREGSKYGIEEYLVLKYLSVAL
jgi:succinate-semialdehyde dehydrogenase/glutarate-semialdehyde dehydrogenase